MKKSVFGKTTDGDTAFLYELKNSNGLSAVVSNFGGILKELYVPDQEGKLDNVVLGFSNPLDYIKEDIRAGAIVGRIAGRLSSASFSVDNSTYKVTPNEGSNHLHGGRCAMDKKLWDVRYLEYNKGEALELTYFSPEGEEGYPGNVEITATYYLTNANSFIIEFQAKTDKTTPLSLTNHSYFNLNGNGTIGEHLVQIAADWYAPVNEEFAFTGKREKVKKGVNDFRSEVRMKDYIGPKKHYGSLYQLKIEVKDQWVAKAFDPISGRKLEVYTSQDFLQFYNSKYVHTKAIGHHGKPYKAFEGLCFECHGFPNAPNDQSFPSIFLRPGEVYKERIEYKFGW